MPLLDHFHPPLSTERHWEAFHGRWATAIADALNADLLPTGYFAEAQVHVGGRVEVDVATFDSTGPRPGPLESMTGEAGIALADPATWAAPAPAISLPAVFPDLIEVLVYDREAGPTLVAAVALVSPGNKDLAETRTAFATKCATYLREGIGLVVIDVVTSRQANLHDELMRLMNANRTALIDATLYAVAYAPVRPSEAHGRIDIWPSPPSVGQRLPSLPLPIGRGRLLPLHLEASYTETRRRSRIA